MTDDEPKSFSMEEAMQAIRDASGTGRALNHNHVTTNFSES